MPQWISLRFLSVPVSLLVPFLVLPGVSAPASAETVQVGPRETIVEHRLSEGERLAEFVVDRLCYGSNAPTVISRFVIRYYEAAALGFVKAPDSEAAIWIGDDLRAVRDTYAQARRMLPGGGHDISDAEAVRSAARAELALADRELREIFPTSGDATGARTFRVGVSGPGDRRTISVSGCYSDSDLKEILRLRRISAERLLAASGESQ